ncbi:hypothetical protein MycrhN_2376 [Mycolicibacterium rhodesiae NBB3]|uniref:Uncharacterized protein n=1 Tax=Mycolicibacterium rhodesiae (strain NBB3) TaxID=710685 RepID=G8RV93_MYCRN|nr:hypothetical protein MycrhN_2376 [Mycolicibacterium rhodesiae NBB3]
MAAEAPARSPGESARPSGVPALSRPLQGVGGLFVMSADAVKFLFHRPFQGREFVGQSWFIVRVSLVPTLLVAIDAYVRCEMQTALHRLARARRFPVIG